MARRRLPRVVFDYLDGAAEDEITLAQNRAAFRRYAFVPRVLSGSPPRDLAVTLFGQTLGVPWVVGPTGLNGILWLGADFALARAAERAGAAYAHATAANVALESFPQSSAGFSSTPGGIGTSGGA
jgi:(S)-mandelate dehydrogenase